MKSPVPECVWPVGAELGEGPVWLASEGALWFVDIKGRRIHRFDEASGGRRSWPAPEPIGFLAPVEGGGFLCGLKSGLYRFDPDTGAFEAHLTGFEPTELDNRLNDGFVDADGRLWFGSMHDGETEASGALYRLEDGPSVRRWDEGYHVTNGPATSPDGRLLYHVDTLKRTIWTFDVDDEGGLSGKRVFTHIERPGAYPDGLAVDVEGGVWVALFAGWGVERFDPAGRLAARIEMPCANVTKPAFGGPKLKTLYLTTAWMGLSEQARVDQALAGGLFRLEMDLDGLAQNCVRLIEVATTRR